ncbi:DUF2235 domain-containing protein [Shewanella xiamenensis]|uniref:DUF2235 domain-containing protein n=1 Tax=Shewanella TaxID=22 RepID=UPI00146B6CC1|nr:MULTISPECIES: DUF2235 domain-containing protein [Shewanella]MCT8861566.1 DUF2235 domain-containing protein [Shewanella xiamenensis]NMD51387.1 DUF2235 domain-containing protein [Shewanella sp. DNRA4]UWG65514.1 DUF2235 domain-containing protein [Shewanella xiamenensis]BDA61984.1 hypothetical protein NUITMVS1_34470 [Shewanella xiamenensis]
MNKRIVICADGTWNRPEKDLKVDFPTNVLRLARAISPMAADGKPQQVFYDWGVGSYYDEMIGGATGRGLHKNIMDGYRYIVQNYSPGDEIYLFGFSRGAYTVRCLCGLINNCGILKRPDARLIQQAFDHYKKSSEPFAPSGDKSVEFRQKHSHESREIKFVGVWDTVGAMGIPISFLGLFEDKDEFYDTKIGRNVRVARHALAIDEHRSDFEPTIWQLRDNMDMQQVWFAGAHSNIGGSYQPDKDGSLLSDNALSWMIAEAERFNLSLEPHLTASLHPNPLATLHDSRRSFYRIKQPYLRPLDPNVAPVLLHHSVKVRWEQDPKYRPKNLQAYLEKFGWPQELID